MPTLPLPRAHQPFALAGSSGGVQQQCHSDFRCGIGEHAGSIGHGNTSRFGGRHVYVIEAHTKICQQSGSDRRGAEQFRRQHIGHRRAQYIGPSQSLGKLCLGHWFVVWVDPQLKDLSHGVFDGLGPTSGE